MVDRRYIGDVWDVGGDRERERGVASTVDFTDSQSAEMPHKRTNISTTTVQYPNYTCMKECTVSYLYDCM